MTGRALFVMFAYHGGDRDSSPGRWLGRWESSASRGHRIVHRDHYANPRTLPYQVALVGGRIDQRAHSGQDLVVDRRLDGDLAEPFRQLFGTIEAADVADRQAWSGGLLRRLRDYDQVVLVYADALGLGCEAGERQAVLGHRSVVVINGRRRVFRLDANLQRTLPLHRFLARTRIVERSLAVIIRPFAAMLAFWDRRVLQLHD